MTRASARDRYVELRRRVLTPNAIGEQVESWPTAYASVWAKKADVNRSRGDKSSFAGQETVIQITEFTISFRTDLSATDRVVDTETGSVFEVLTFVESGGRHRDLTVTCRTVLA